MATGYMTGGAAGSYSSTSQTAGTIPPAIRSFYNRTLLERALPALCYERFGQQCPVDMNSGDQPKFRRYESLTAAIAPLSEGITPSPVQASVTDVVGQLKTYGNYMVCSDTVQFVNQDRVVTELTTLLGENMGLSKDTIIRDVVLGTSSVYYAGGAAATTRHDLAAAISEADLKKIYRTFRRNNVPYWTENPIQGNDKVGTQPIRPAYFAIVHPDLLSTLFGFTTWVHAANYPDQSAVLPNEVGSIHGFRFLESSNAKIFLEAATDTAISTTWKGVTYADVYCTMIFGKNSFGVTPLTGHSAETIIKPLGSGGTADPMDQRTTIAWKMVMDAIILNDTNMLRYEHLAAQ